MYQFNTGEDIATIVNKHYEALINVYNEQHIKDVLTSLITAGVLLGVKETLETQNEENLEVIRYINNIR